MPTATAQEQQWAQQFNQQAQAQRMAAMIPPMLGALAHAQAAETQQSEQAQMQAAAQAQSQQLGLAEQTAEEGADAPPVESIKQMTKQYALRLKVLGDDIQAEIDGTKRNMLSMFDWANAGATDAAGVVTGGTLSTILGFFTYPVMIILGIMRMWQYAGIRYSPGRAQRRIASLTQKALQRVVVRALVGIIKIVPFINMIPFMSIVLGWEETQKKRHDEALQGLQKSHKKQMQYLEKLQSGKIKEPRRQMLVVLAGIKKVTKLEQAFDAL